MSLNYRERGDLETAKRLVQRAIAIRALPDYRYLLANLLEPDEPEAATSIYAQILTEIPAQTELADAIKGRLREMGSIGIEP